MADSSSDPRPGAPPPDDARPNPVPDPHRDEPTPVRAEHTRDAPDADVVRPDQQESDLGPIGELMHAASAEAAAEATGSEAAEAEALDSGAEAEGVEAAQIFSLMLVTAVTLVLAVVGVVFLVKFVADGETAERDAVELYPELEETRTRAAAKLNDYSREDDLYRMPIDAAMASVVESYDAQQQGATPAPANFDMVYLDANRADRLGLDPVGADEGLLPTQEGDADVLEDGGATADEIVADEVATDEVEADEVEAPTPAVVEEPEDR